jgi:ABC-2 type transport system ATP-binding protein
MTSGLPAVVVDGLCVDRGGQRVVDDVTFTLAGGEVTGLLGPSGGGKSTVMRSLVGVQIVASGRVELLGLPAGDRALRSRVGYVTQAPSVYDDLTVGENVAYFAKVLGASSSLVDGVIERVDLTASTNRLVGQLSGGQRSRVSLATALLGSPDVLVLDEPTVGLDPVLRRDLWQLFASLAADGTCVLVSSHVMDEASRCDRLLLMRSGRLVADTTPDGLLRSTGQESMDAAFLALIEEEGS